MFEQMVIESLLWIKIFPLAEDGETEAQVGDKIYLRLQTLGSVQFKWE